MTPVELRTALKPHLAATRFDDADCMVFDWADAKDGELAEQMSDIFNDGYPAGFAQKPADTLIPFAILGMTADGDGDGDGGGQPEGVLFCDTAAKGAIVLVDVDGTAIVSTRKVVAPSLAALADRLAK